jgi:hypothetical protein
VDFAERSEVTGNRQPATGIRQPATGNSHPVSGIRIAAELVVSDFPAAVCRLPDPGL